MKHQNLYLVIVEFYPPEVDRSYNKGEVVYVGVVRASTLRGARRKCEPFRYLYDPAKTVVRVSDIVELVGKTEGDDLHLARLMKKGTLP